MDYVIQQTVNGVSLGAMYALIALGYTMVYGIMRLINFAHGDVFMIGAYVSYFVISAMQTPGHPGGLGVALVALLVSMAACALLGVTIERLAYRPLRSAPRIAVLITAIGVSFLLENLAIVFKPMGPNPRGFPTVIANTPLFTIGKTDISNQQIIMLVVSFGLMFGLHFIVQHTRIGKAMRAVSYDQDAARLMGINVNAVIAWTFVIGSALAAAAGLLFAMRYPRIDAYMGVMPGLKAFIAAVLGGIGNIPGAVIGGLLMGIAETFVAGSPYSTYKDAVAFVILIAILIVRPTGLLGKGMVEKV